MLVRSFRFHLGYTLDFSLQDEKTLMVKIDALVLQKRCHLRKSRRFAIDSILGAIIAIRRSSHYQVRFRYDLEGI